MMRIVRFILALLLGGCVAGPRVENFAPAQNPSGVEASVELSDRTSVRGELLAVEKDAIVLLVGNRVTRIAVANIARASFRQASVGIERGRMPDAPARERLRLLSRFPQGLTPPLLGSLLSAYGQSEIAVLPK